MAKTTITGRQRAVIDGDFVVFLIGARPQLTHPLRTYRDLGGRRGMLHMLNHLMAHPEKGLLAYELSPSTSPCALRSSGISAMPYRSDCRGTPAPRPLLAVNPDLPGRAPLEPGERPQQRATPGTHQAADAEDLAGSHLEAHALERPLAR